MGVRVAIADNEHVTLTAPLAPNVNHRETVFGGSAASVATLAAWVLLYVRLKQAQTDVRIVIQRSHMHYTRPIAGDFSGTAEYQDVRGWQRFSAALQRKGRARITIRSTLHYARTLVAEFDGDFVAIANRP